MSKKILVVDDEKHIVQIVKFNLEKRGNYEVVTASNGQEGLEVYQAENPDLIISDIMMPGMTGFEFYEELRKTDSRTPFIILTAKGQDSYYEEGKEKGIVDFLTKPFSPKALLARVKEMLGE
jgi:DNA-binding response OmpR family regulator